MENTIDTLGHIPTIILDPPVKLNAKRQYHVGLNRHFNPIKRRYYEHRGWIRDIYYVKPQQSAWLEWLHCMVSPRHAKASWLRLTPEAEAKATLITKRVVIGLFVAVAFTAGMIVGEYRMLHYVKAQQKPPLHIRLLTGEQTT